MINNPSSIAISVFDSCTHGEKQLTANVATIVIPVNTKRKYAAIINDSSVNIALTLGELTKVSNNIGLILKPGGSYEVNANNLYVGTICALSKFACKLSFVECIE